MPAFRKPEYPKSLTTSDWSKHKGVLAKIMRVKTGVTEELTATRRLFDAVPWDKLDLTLYVPHRAGKAELDAAMKKLNADTVKAITAAYHSMRDLSGKLKSKAGEYGKNAKTKETAKQLLKMADDANKFSYAIAPGTISDPISKEYDRYVADIAKKEQVLANQRGIFKTYVSKALVAVQGAMTKPMTATDYKENLWSEHLRGFGAAAKVLIADYPGLKSPMQIAMKQWMQDALPKNDPAVPAQLKKDFDLLRQFNQFASQM